MDYDDEYLAYIESTEISGGYRVTPEPEEKIVYVPSGAPTAAPAAPGAGHHVIQPGTDPNKHIVKPGDYERIMASGFHRSGFGNRNRY